MTDGMKPTEWPWLAWSNGLDHYPIKCVVQEQPAGIYSIVVSENGIEVEREAASSWPEARDHIESLRQRYQFKVVPKPAGS